MFYSMRFMDLSGAVLRLFAFHVKHELSGCGLLLVESITKLVLFFDIQSDIYNIPSGLSPFSHLTSVIMNFSTF